MRTDIKRFENKLSRLESELQKTRMELMKLKENKEPSKKKNILSEWEYLRDKISADASSDISAVDEIRYQRGYGKNESHN